MKTPMAVVLVLWLGALVPAFATPARFGTKEDPLFRVIPLQQPDEVVASEAPRHVVPTPLLRASPLPGASASGKVNNRIVHGEPATECQFPYQVALNIDGAYFCGGSLIDGRWVLTAAHCISGAVMVQVRAGGVDWTEAPVAIYAKRAIVHGGFNDWLHNDIGILDLGENIEDECIKSVELETKGCGTDELDAVSGTVSGWGRTGDQSDGVELNLRFVETTTITNNDCFSVYGPTIIESGICSKSSIGASGTLCHGDSGGPLVHGDEPKQIGINSFVHIYGCESSNPSGYARVPCFIDWIRAAQAL